jgi:hypothetical protein
VAERVEAGLPVLAPKAPPEEGGPSSFRAAGAVFYSDACKPLYTAIWSQRPRLKIALTTSSLSGKLIGSIAPEPGRKFVASPRLDFVLYKKYEESKAC